MITDRELDRILTDWLAGGDERAPRRDVETALAVVATTSQRSRTGLLRRAGRATGRRWILAAALLLIAIGAAIGVGSGLIRLPPSPPPHVPTELKAVQISDWSVQLSIPEGWTEVGPEIAEYRHFAGTSPEGHLSASHESPYAVTVCSPDCQTVEIPPTIPYSAQAQLTALRTGVAAVVGSSAWVAIPEGTVSNLTIGARVDTTAVDDTGRSWRRVHIVGIRDRNVAAIAWSQPADVFDSALLDAVLAGIDLPSAPVYSDGDVIYQRDDEFGMPMPGLWVSMEQPTLDGALISGLRRYGDGRITVSIGSPDGTLGWCDPDCRLVADQVSMDAVERTVRADQALGVSVPVTLGGEPARMFGTDTPVQRRYVVAMHGPRPVALKIDAGDWNVAPGIVDGLIDGFVFTDPVIAPPDQVFTVGSRAEIGLPADWRQEPGDDGAFSKTAYELTVRVGDRTGSVVTCDRPAGPWERCRKIQATTLDDLADAVRPVPPPDGGHMPAARSSSTTLDGEPGVVVRIQAYEPPARGGQEVAYVVAMHAGRPYVLRVWTSHDSVTDLGSIIANFRFTD